MQVLSFFLLLSIVLVQPTEVTTFEYLSTKHFIHFDRATAGQVDGIQIAIENAMDVFEPLWDGTTPVILVDLVTPPALDAEGNPLVGAVVSRLDPRLLPLTLPDPPTDVCLIEFYTLPDLIHITFDVAKAVAHCYQWYNVPALEGLNPTTLGTHSWWYEGSAVWMASLLDDSIALNIWEKIQTDFIDRIRQTLVKGGQDTYYFWHYAADALGEENIISLLVFMPDDVNDHADYVADKLGDAELFMHSFAFKVANGDVPHAPDADALFKRVPVNRMPYNAVFSSEKLGVGFVQLNINVTLEADEAIELTVLTDEASGLEMMLNDETPLNKDEPVRICDPLVKPRIIFSRAVAGTDVDPPDEAQMEVLQLDCDDAPVVETETEDVSTCIVGSWELIQQPRLPGADMAFTGTQRVTVGEDGSTLTEYEAFTMATSVEDVGLVMMEFNGTATSKLSVDSSGYVVDGGETIVDVMATITVAGTTMTMPLNDLGAAASEIGIQPGTRITCNSAFLHLNVPVEGVDGPYIFTRVLEN